MPVCNGENCEEKTVEIRAKSLNLVQKACLLT